MIESYYEVVAKCGHVGRKHYIPISFAIKANDGKEAARVVRDYPRVKHNHKDAILDVFKISYERYLEIINDNNNDPYLKCHSRQEQERTCDLESRLVKDTHHIKKSYDEYDRFGKVSFTTRKYKLKEKELLEESSYFKNDFSNMNLAYL